MSPQSYCDAKSFNLNFLIILTISIAILWNNKKEHFWNNFVLLTITIMTTGVVIYFLKHFFARPRPLSVFGEENVNILFEKLYTNSFPSGHSQLAFTVCTFMFMTVKKYWYWYIIMALLASFERVYAGSHFPFDVLIGVVLGTFCSYTIVVLSKKFKNRKST
jgi:undecaprenyl-diphosphatase